MELYSSTSLEARTRMSGKQARSREYLGQGGGGVRVPGIGADRQSLGADADCGIPHPPEAYLIQGCGLLTLAKRSRSSPVARRLAARGVQSMSVATFMLTDSSVMRKLTPAETHKT